jgi:hypothetical protein
VPAAPPPYRVTDPPLPGQVTEASPHFDLEILYTQEKFAEGLTLARERLEASPNDKDLIWMVVRFTFSEAEGKPSPDKKETEVIYGELAEFTTAALEMYPNDPHLLFARGLAKGRLGTSRGVLSSLFMADDIEADWLASAESGYQYSSLGGAEVLPCDVYIGLGIFYRLVPDWWIVKLLSGTRGDLYKSLDYQEKAVNCNENIRSLKEVGVSAMCLGVKTRDEAIVDAGRSYIRQMMEMTPNTQIEHIDISHGSALLADPGLACEYSRDGQQDLNRENLKDGKTK